MDAGNRRYKWPRLTLMGRDDTHARRQINRG